MTIEQLVDRSWLQFAATMLYYFLFVPRHGAVRWLFSTPAGLLAIVLMAVRLSGG